MSAVANVHMKIEGPKEAILGESRVKGYVDWIELDEWNWAIGFQEPPGVKGKATGNRNVEAVPSVLTFRKLMDRATTAMLSAMAKGEILTVTMAMIEASDEPFQLDILLEDARLTEYDADFKSEDKSVEAEESWTLDYRRINFAYAVGARAGPQAVLERPSWASTDKPQPKGQDREEEVIKLTDSLSEAALEKLYQRMKDAAKKKREGSPG